MTVNFTEIGWNNWIIAPQAFDAARCLGQCLFPIAKHLRPTNHAIIQAILYNIQSNKLSRTPSSAQSKWPLIQQPSCVPDTLQSISLLYFDETNNAVLRTYDDMTAISCACR